MLKFEHCHFVANFHNSTEKMRHTMRLDSDRGEEGRGDGEKTDREMIQGEGSETVA